MEDITPAPNQTMAQFFEEQGLTNGINYLKSLLPSRPVRPIKPSLKLHPTAAEAREYADRMDVFEKINGSSSYKEALNYYNNRQSETNDLIEECIKINSGFYVSVPPAYQQKVWECACINGDGWYEQAEELDKLINIFENPSGK